MLRWILLLFIVPRMFLLAEPAFADFYQSKTYTGAQDCNGGDQLLLVRGPWLKNDITIIGVSLTHIVVPPTPLDHAMVGSSAVQGDILIHVTNGAANITGLRSVFPGAPSPDHIDVHAKCAEGSWHEAWVTIHYLTPVLGPHLDDNDKSEELCKKHPQYCKYTTSKKRSGFFR